MFNKILDKIKQNRDLLFLFYKLLNDSFLLLLAFFAIALIAESILPSIVTRHVSFLKIIFLLIITFSLLYLLGGFLQIKFSLKKYSRRDLLWPLFIATFIIFSSSIRMGLGTAFFITALSLLTIFLLYENIFQEKI